MGPQSKLHSTTPARIQTSSLWLRFGFWASIVIAIAIVIRRIVALAFPSPNLPPQMAALDAVFDSRAALTLAHILPALVFVLILPFVVFSRFSGLRWPERAIFPLGIIVAITAYAMSTFSVGGWTERSAVLFFNSLFLFSLLRAYGYSRRGEQALKRRWLLRAIAVLLGIATTRPVMGVFFATSSRTHLAPNQFFGIAFWIGFSINWLAFEIWIRSVTVNFKRKERQPFRIAENPPEEKVPMTAQANHFASSLAKHPGPPLWLLAILYTVLFIAGIFPVTMFGGLPYWPGPWEPASVIVPYFQTHETKVLACVFLQIGANICLGLFTATIVSRLHFLGVRAAGAFIALFGGFLVVFDAMAAGFTTWALVHPIVAQTPSSVLALYYLSYAFGGPGFSIPMGLLMAGVSVSAGFMKLLPRWIVALGLFLAAAGELSTFHLLSPSLLFLVPLVRFPGFIWIIAVGFAMPRSRRALAEIQAAQN